MNSYKLKERNGDFKLEIYIIDAVAFLAYLADNLPKKADLIFKQAEKNETKLLLPSIALGETLYTIYKGKEIFGKNISLNKIEFIFQILQDKDIIELINLNLEAWRIFYGLNIPELHDRMIIASYFCFKVTGIVTNDSEIAEQVPTVWE